MKYTKENIIDGIKAKINTINEPEVIKRMFVEKISQYPVEIEQNILEWVNDKPLTKIECHGESLVEIIERWGFDNSVVHR